VRSRKLNVGSVAPWIVDMEVCTASPTPMVAPPPTRGPGTRATGKGGR
jgi:hypothetical protein